MTFKKYAVGVINFFDNDNVVHIVTAENPVDAVKLAISDADYIDSLEEEMGEMDLETLLDELFNADIVASIPVEI